VTVDTRTWVEAERAKLAKRANEFVKNAQIREALTSLDPTALRTLLGAAANASCLDEVLILLRYQQGRDRVKWRDVLVAGLEKQLQELVEVATRRTETPADLDAAGAMLATAWLGFLVQIHRFHYEAAREARKA
jgi:hypothetical protein